MDIDAAPVLPPATGVRRIARRVLRPVRAGLAGLLVACQGPDEDGWSTIAIGDSHAVLLLDGWMPSPPVARRDRSATTLYLGPRLMFSVAREGWPRWVHRLLRLRVRSPLARGKLRVVVVHGEIDLRCHLGKPGQGSAADIEDLARGYVARARSLLRDLRTSDGVVLLGPNPPSEEYVELYQWYPVVGSVAERTQLLDSLCRSLEVAVTEANDPRLRFVDVRPLVAGADGALRPELTFDGCHLNRVGAATVRETIAVALP